MNPRRKAKLARMGLLVATIISVTLIYLNETVEMGVLIPLIPLFIALIPYFIYERCPQCGALAFISRDSVKFCPACGSDIDSSSQN